MRPLLALLLARTAEAIAPADDADTRLARARLHLGLALLDMSDALLGLPPWVDVMRVYLEPVAASDEVLEVSDVDHATGTVTFRAAPRHNARGGAA